MKAMLGALVASFGLAMGAAHAATISLSPSSLSSAPGAALTLNLNISGLGAGTALGAFDLSVNFDSARLDYVGTLFGDPLLGDQLDLQGLGFNAPTATAGTGTIDLVEADLFDSPSDPLSQQATSFTLATLTFSALTAGTTPITLSLHGLSDQDGNPFTAVLDGATISIQAVPLPGAVTLMLSGLAAVGTYARRRRVLA